MLRGIALISDAISHALVLGIVVMFLLTQQLYSPLLILGASAAGMLTVVLTEYSIQTRKIKEDAALGLIYPLLFSIGIILTSYYARNTHIDTDMVLLGELAFAPFDRLYYGSLDLGPQALWTMGTIMTCVLFACIALFKELTLATFDTTEAYLHGFKPDVLYYLLMALANITVVGAFNVVGSIVVVALIITPSATAFLYTRHLKDLLILSCCLSSLSALLGCFCAIWLDISIAGSIACCNGALFLGAYLAQQVQRLLKTNSTYNGF